MVFSTENVFLRRRRININTANPMMDRPPTIQPTLIPATAPRLRPELFELSALSVAVDEAVEETVLVVATEVVEVDDELMSVLF